MKKYLILFLLVVSSVARAEEGMLIPSLIQAFESDMKAMGMRLSASDIYNVNQSSIKDAIMHFGGGCTAEIVSKEGLLLTNHHCGYSQVQSHSSLEKDYLKYGFWAKTHAEELPNPGLTATRIVRIDDVTESMLSGTAGIEDPARINEIMAGNMKTLIEDAKRGTHYQADIQAFDYGNSYYLMVKEVFLDVRLVGAPPSSIGKFGGDTDNWVWPRHTGDFSVFRIYAGKDNKPAAYSADNVPYTPLHHLPIAFKNRKEGEFTMVYGFPGLTEQHLSSGNLKYIVDKQRPMEISMRTKSLSVIDAAMRSSDQTRIQYSAKQARIANAWKKNIGQIDGLKQLDAVGKKMEFEAEYVKRANSKEEWKKYAGLVDKMNKLVEEKSTYEFHFTLYVEYLLVGPEMFKLARALEDLETNYDKYKASGELQKKIDNLIKGSDAFFKDYDAKVDRDIFNLLTAEFNKYAEGQYAVAGAQKAGLSEAIYTKSILVNKEKYVAFLKKLSEGNAFKKLKKDAGYNLFKECWSVFQKSLRPNAGMYSDEMDALLKVYVEGKRVMFPDMKHWSDANSTLRITYGKLEGSAPTDGMMYTSHTTLAGIIAKNQIANPDFELLPRMTELFRQKDYGDYAQDGELWVCFTGSNHTTGGNSGSPVLNADGHLMGLNFDRSWESTMSDYLFDPSRCRNIVVDIRYVLWVMDKYAGAKHLVDEMTLVK
ncbi:MAG TPA: S46 family peptidase [Fluviicola sp.]|nr:S46 family peptidase [Fluviicola sp.]